jgi:cytochrome c5
MRMDSLHTRRSPASVLMVLIMAAASGAALGSGLFEDGASVYREVCSSCHGPGPVAAPKYGDAAAWKPLIEEGQHVITAHGWVGVREMPPRGGEPELRLEEFGRAVAYMARAAGADWLDPDRDARLMADIRRETAARIASLREHAAEPVDRGRTGPEVYAQVCTHCHETGVAGAPRRGDRDAWAELIGEGQHVVTAHGWVGVRAMPPRGGHAELSLQEFSRAVAHMANSAGAGWSDPSDNAVLLGKIRVEEADRRRKLSQADAGLETRKYD